MAVREKRPQRDSTSGIDTPGVFYVNVPFSAEEIRLIEEGARAHEMKRTPYVRMMAVRAARGDKTRGFPPLDDKEK